MKRILFFCLLTILVGIACKSDSKKAESTTTTTPEVTAPADNSTPNVTAPANLTPVPGPQSTEPAQNAKGVWHFTCPKGCAGGGAGATPCGKCGATLAHNQAYHAQ
ncbi:MAG: hypothetical protein HOP11_09905 [Saprospiraceae bacterium]|nr:hypothetical protein [Saprospiraceae bacterium]